MNKRLKEIKENITVIADHAVCMTKTDYDWLINNFENQTDVKVDVHSPAFLGTYTLSDLISDREVLGTGSLIEINGEKHYVNNIMIRSDWTIVLEVNKSWGNKK